MTLRPKIPIPIIAMHPTLARNVLAKHLIHEFETRRNVQIYHMCPQKRVKSLPSFIKETRDRIWYSTRNVFAHMFDLCL